MKTVHDAKVEALAGCYYMQRCAGLSAAEASAEARRLVSITTDTSYDDSQIAEGIAQGITRWAADG